MRPRPSLYRRVLAFVLIACFPSAWALPALVQSQSQMSCCRKGSDHSCCRRTQSDAATLTASNTCGTRCAAIAVAPLPAFQAPKAGSTERIQATDPFTSAAPANPELIRQATCQLFERPPPAA